MELLERRGGEAKAITPVILALSRLRQEDVKSLKSAWATETLSPEKQKQLKIIIKKNPNRIGFTGWRDGAVV